MAPPPWRASAAVSALVFAGALLLAMTATARTDGAPALFGSATAWVSGPHGPEAPHIASSAVPSTHCEDPVGSGEGFLMQW